MAVSEVALVNLALQKLGAARITSLSEDSRNARSVNACYKMMRDRELRAHKWHFARKQQVLTPDTAAPAFDYSYQFTWPTDCLRVLKPRNGYVDWQLAGRKIMTNMSDTLNLDYIARITNTTLFDPTFDDGLACKIAWHCCEEITQSNQKKADIMTEYRMAIAEARRTNAIEVSPEEFQEDPWLSARR
ncbi:MAG: hypothetical protein KG075_09535 [Alphaproteobacteria bacterium]|nr:hypothetical protein [Alphaproteobacteria bacterium]